jgi:hypothetical protein
MHVVQSLFPDRYVAIAIPLFFVVVLIGVNLIFIGWTLLVEPRRRLAPAQHKSKSRRRTAL